MVTGIEAVEPWEFKGFREFIQERSVPAAQGYIERPIVKEEILKATRDVLGE